MAMRYPERTRSTRRNAWEVCVAPLLQSSAEQVTRLRGSLNDLRGIMALPAVWTGGEPPRIVSTSIEALQSIANELEERVAQRTRELARADEALAESERNSRLVIDSIPGLVALLTAAGEVQFVNRQILEYTGQTLEELKQWGTNGTVHPEDLPHVAQVFTQSIASGTPYEIVQRLRRSDGVYRWFQNGGFPLRDSSGQIVRWCVLLTDIDERKHAEDALRESERESRLIVDCIPGFVATFTRTGEVEFVNRPILEYFGRTLEELKRWGTGGMTHPEDLPRVVECFTRSMVSGDPFEFEVRARRFDGVYRWFQSRGFPLRDHNGQIVRWYNLLIDIDERKRAEAELRRAYDSFAEAQRLSKTGSFITDLVGDEHNWSEEAYRIFEFDPASTVTVQRVRDIIHPDDLPSFDSVIARGMSGVDVNFAFRIVTLRGAVKHVRGVAHVIEQIEGRPMFVGALQDVTESMVAEEALNRARSELAHVARVTTLSMLTASITHEINQPLSGIITNAGTCLRMLDVDPPNVEGARETARRTIRDGSRASEVIMRLRLLFSKRESTLESLDLNEATQEVIALSRSDLQRNRVVLQSDLADDLPSVSGDRIQLQQVILNLIRNASDAMLGLHDRPRHLLIRTEREDGDRVRVSVRDAGVGVDAQSMNKLFDAFYTTKADGMGIGLSVSRSIIERHHGRLWAEPNDGPGATFSFSIPAVLRAP
jgi:PAS domain S-box-containing protein